MLLFLLQMNNSIIMQMNIYEKFSCQFEKYYLQSNKFHLGLFAKSFPKKLEKLVQFIL
jgi:hypothetical protein